MRPMKVEVDERDALNVAELVASSKEKKGKQYEAAGKGGTRKPGDDHLGGFITTYL